MSGLWIGDAWRYGARTPIDERSVSHMNPMTIILVEAPLFVGALAC